MVAGALAGVAACLESRAVVCGELVCAAGTVCARVTEPDGSAEDLCVEPGQLAACEGRARGDRCTLGVDDDARCYDGVCLTGGCGNRRIDDRDGEVCDDGNTTTGDGCSAECRSKETCGNGHTDPIVGGGPGGEQCDDGNLERHDGCSPGCVIEQPQWERVRYGVPVARDGQVMGYDPVRGRMLMFGGQPIVGAGNLRGNELWAWSGHGWYELTQVFGPPPRLSTVGVYDAARDRLVVFGGEDFGGEPLEDTWEWDGARWEPRFPAMTPPPRTLSAMAYDAGRRRAVLFGGTPKGIVMQRLDDTWEWDGTTWTRIELPRAATPPPLAAHAMTYDARRGVVVLVGTPEGLNGTKLDLWEYDGTGWTPIAFQNGPSRRIGATLTYDPARGHVVLDGGEDGGVPLDDTWAWDGQTWSEFPPPGERVACNRHVAAADPFRGELVRVCNKEGGAAETSRWDGASWRTVRLELPGAAIGHAAAFDALRGRMVARAGTALLELVGESWLAVGAGGPPALLDAAMAYHAGLARTVLFGAAATTAHTWSWDGAAWTQHAGPQPSARTSHAMAYDAARGEIVLFGGSQGGDETWVWNGAWTRRFPATTPPARDDHALGYDPVRGRVVMFGGRGIALLDDTWEWDGVDWRLAPTTLAPSRRAGAALAWNPARRRLVLYGGLITPTALLEDTWEWNGTAWSIVQLATSPPARFGHTLVTSADGSGVTLFGGQGPGSIYPELWTLRWSAGEGGETCRYLPDTDGDGLAGCADSDCWATCAPLCVPGAACAADAPRCGDGVCNAFLESYRSCPADCPGAPRCGDFVCEPDEVCPGDCAP